MMFRRLILRFGAKKRNEEFEVRLEHEQVRGRIFEIASDRSWCISLSQPIDELSGSLGWVMRLYNSHNEMVCEARLVHDATRRTVLIGDIVSYIEGRGYGSIMLSRIVELARRLGIRELKGNLSSTDSNHFDKLEHFYKKHGFKVRFDPRKLSGSIVMRLSEKHPPSQST